MVKKRVMELWVGIFVTAGIIALGMLSLKVGNLGAGEAENPYIIKLRFDNIGGLKPRSSVTMAGVRIGRVLDIGFDHQQYRAVVQVSIDGRYKIPDDASAAILTSGLLGEQYIGISPGGSEIFLKTGDEITITQSALILEDLVGKIMVRLTEGSGTESK